MELIDYIYYETYIMESKIVANIVGKRIGRATSLNRGKIYLATNANHDTFICSGYSGWENGYMGVKAFFEKTVPVKMNIHFYKNIIFFDNNEDETVFKEIFRKMSEELI